MWFKKALDLNELNKEFSEERDEAISDYEVAKTDENVNDLIDIQTTIGATQTKEMITLLDKFSTFMIGSIALAIALLGSIIYDIFKNTEKPVKKPVRRTPARTTTPRKPAPRKKAI